jgi:sortase A
MESPPPTPEPYPLGQPIARLCIPSARIDAIVFGGSDPDILAKGPGHIPGTELPGGRSGRNNCVITAHRDSNFRNLGSLRKGQRIELETPGGEESYRVVSEEIVDPSAVRVLAPTAMPRLTLITCYPFHYIGPAPRRFVVVAELDPPPQGP